MMNELGSLGFSIIGFSIILKNCLHEVNKSGGRQKANDCLLEKIIGFDNMIKIDQAD